MWSAEKHRATVVAGILLIHAGILFYSLSVNYVTVDEVGHVPAGLANWELGEFSLYRENPPLSRLVATLPVWLAHPATDYSQLNGSPGSRSETQVGHSFLHANGPRYFLLMRLARLSGMAWSILAGLVVWAWARELYGPAAGWLGLVVWCFGPNVIAHAQLATPDIPAAAAAVTATYIFRGYLHRPTWRGAALSGVALGLALLTKFTLLILCVCWPILWIVGRLGKSSGAVRVNASRWAHAQQGSVIVLLSLLVINVGYEFDHTGHRLGEFPFVSATLTGINRHERNTPPVPFPDNRFRGTWWGGVIVPLPAQYLLGIDSQRRDFEVMSDETPSYLRGEFRAVGWWYYYLYALAVKVPLGVWGLLTWSCWRTFVSRRRTIAWREELLLGLPAAAVLALVSSQTGLNAHMRYVLPMFPFVVISLSKVARVIEEKNLSAQLLLAGCVGWSTISSVSLLPHSLSYFNELAGGPENGPRHLLDSNVDWGQDLLFLKQWIDAHPEARPLGLAYFKSTELPRSLGIEFELPPPGPPDSPPSDRSQLWQCGPQPGWFAISVNYVQGLSFVARRDSTGSMLVPRMQELAYFQNFAPVARVGYSLRIYNISLAEANRVRHQLGLPELPTSD
jgi:4-amino-4-deoxy-L-arabinose transferase-like glycosyltransferase